MNILLLINTNVPSTSMLVDSCLPNVSVVLYDQNSDTFSGLLEKIAALNISTFDEVGIVFDGMLSMYTFTLLNTQLSASILNNVQIDDPELSSWSEISDFLGKLANIYSMKTLDFFACSLYSNPSWQYVFNTISAKLGILIQASTDATGNENTFTGGVTSGADWIMESNGVNIKDKYFNDNITNYQYNFGGAQGLQMSAVIINGIPRTAGYNNLSGLGNGTNRGTYTLNYTPMTNLPAGLTAIDIAVTSTSTFVIFSNGKVYGCGGVFSVQNSTLSLVLNAPVGKTASFLSAGYYTTMVVFSDGSIYSIGTYDGVGEMGGTYPIGTNFNSTSAFSYNSTPMPIPLSGLIPIKVMRNDGNTLILYSNSAGGNNRVFICGFNNWGQYGNGTTSTAANKILTEIVSPAGLNPINICSCKLATVIQYSNNTIYMCGILTGDMFGNPIGTQYHTLTQINLSSLPAGVTPVDVSAMHRNVYIIGSNGKLYANGVNGWGQLGIGSDSNNNNLHFHDFALVSTLPSNLTVTNVNANQDGVIVMCNDNSVYGTGRNDFGHLAIGTLGAPWSGAPGGQVNSMTRSVAPTTHKVILANQSISTMPASSPAAPTSLVASAAGVSGTISVAFTAGANNGSAISNYKYSTNGTNFTALSPAQTASPVTITGLTNGTSYTLYLKAVNSFGESVASAAASGPVTPYITPSSPTGLSVSGTQVSFTNSDTSVTNYQYSVNNGTTWTPLSPVDAVSPLDFSFLSGGTYSILLRAVNIWDTSSSAGPVSVVIYTPPPAPTLSANGIIISVSAGASNGSTTTHYQWSTNAVTWTTLSSTLTNGGPFTLIPSIAGLAQGQSQLIYVRAINLGLVNGVSASVYITIPIPAYTAPSVTVSGAISPGALSVDVRVVTASANTTLSVGALANTQVETVNLAAATNIDAVPEGTFSGCTSLSSVELPLTLKVIGANSFAGCSSLPSIDIPESVNIIGENALAGTAIEEIILYGEVNVGAYAFSNCVYMINATI